MTENQDDDLLVSASFAASAVQDLAMQPEAFDDLNRLDATRIVNRLVTEAMEPAMRSIVNLCATASNERLRFDAAKYILDLGLPVDGKGDPQSPVEQLIKEIQEAETELETT